jgi:hypothetical protein
MSMSKDDTGTAPDIPSATSMAETPAAPGAEACVAAPASAPLSEAEKVRIWQQRFFEAQASFEEYLMERGGMPVIHEWIEANSAITARRFALLEPDERRRAAYAVTRFFDQLRCYDSDIRREFDADANRHTVENRDCGILRYRREAARARVRLTFESPCEYCTRLNSRIMQKCADGASIEVDYRQGGCRWRIAFPHRDATERDP